MPTIIGRVDPRRGLTLVARLCLLATLAPGLVSCSYVPVSTSARLIQNGLNEGDRVRVITRDGTEFTDDIVRVTGDRLECAGHAVDLVEIESLERREPIRWLTYLVGAMAMFSLLWLSLEDSGRFI